MTDDQACEVPVGYFVYGTLNGRSVFEIEAQQTRYGAAAIVGAGHLKHTARGEVKPGICLLVKDEIG